MNEASSFLQSGLSITFKATDGATVALSRRCETVVMRLQGTSTGILHGTDAERFLSCYSHELLSGLMLILCLHSLHSQLAWSTWGTRAT